jgi:hypothetical protein
MTPQEQNFQDYKKAESKALEILAEMQAAAPKKVDIELALLTSVFELHKGQLPPATIARIIETHLETLVPFYEQSASQPGGN